MNTLSSNDKDSDINVAVQASQVVEHTLEVCLSTLTSQVQDLTAKRDTVELQLQFLNQLARELNAGIEVTEYQVHCLKGQLKQVRDAADLTPRRS